MNRVIIYIMLLAGICLHGCQENDKMTYEAKSSVYFQLSEEYGKTDLDSMIYTFAKGTKVTDTVDLKVKIIGEAVGYDRYFKVEVVDEITSVEQELHYSPLSTEFKVAADSFRGSVPVIIHNTDPELRDTVLCLGLRIVPSSDFDLGVQEKAIAKLYVTDQLTEPATWSRFLKYFFGTYNRTKHKVFMELTGKEFPEDLMEAYGEYGLWKSYGTYLNNYFVENYPVYDEDGEIVEPWQ